MRARPMRSCARRVRCEQGLQGHGDRQSQRQAHPLNHYRTHTHDGCPSSSLLSHPYTHTSRFSRYPFPSQALRLSDAYTARHACAGCTATCDCRAGYFVAAEGNALVCRGCNGVTEFSSAGGATNCTRATICPRGQEERVSPTPTTDRWVSWRYTPTRGVVRIRLSCSAGVRAWGGFYSFYVSTFAWFLK